MTGMAPQDDRVRGANGRFIRTLRGAERDAEACRLRATGKSYREIAEELRYGNAANAHRAISNALAATLKEPADELRTLELQRLDMLWAAAWDVLSTEHVVVNAGQIVIDTRQADLVVTKNGEATEGPPLLDDAPVLKAIGTLVKLAERRAKLLGLDAPVKLSQDGQVRYIIEGIDMEALR